MAIDINPKNKGKLHKKLGIPQGQKIPMAKLESAKAKGGALGKEANFAINAKGFNHSKPKSKKPDLTEDNRKGRLTTVSTPRGDFRFKANRRGE